jgi:hypothetical protein
VGCRNVWFIEFAVLFEEFAIDVGVDVHNAMTESFRNALAFVFVAASLLKRCEGMELAVGQQRTMLCQ